jgi:hypothetical protein
MKRLTLSSLLAFSILIGNFGVASVVASFPSDITQVSGGETREGSLPILQKGDRWVVKIVGENIEGISKMEVVGEDIINGKDCYIMRTLSEYKLPSPKTEHDEVWIDKVTLFPIWAKTQNGGKTIIILFTYEFPDGPLYPLELGKECRAVVKTKITGMGQPLSRTGTYVYKVEEIEEIVVPAGKFTCFKVIGCDPSGYPTSISWRSDKTKLDVKHIMPFGQLGMEDMVQELVSYSVS